MRRLSQQDGLIRGRLVGVELRWLYQGGAGVAWAEVNRSAVRGCHVVVLMVGGNDLANGLSIGQLADRVHQLAVDMVSSHGVGCVVVTSLWPRRLARYNRQAGDYASLMEQRLSPNGPVIFWRWDRRQPWSTCDGVHLTGHGYWRAATYLVAAVVWALSNRIDR